MKRGSMGEVISATTSLDYPSQIESTSGIQFRWLVAIAPSFTFCHLLPPRICSAACPGYVLGRSDALRNGVARIAVYLPLRNQTMHGHYLDLPAGRTAILDPNRYEVYRWMAENTRRNPGHNG